MYRMYLYYIGTSIFITEMRCSFLYSILSLALACLPIIIINTQDPSSHCDPCHSFLLSLKPPTESLVEHYGPTGRHIELMQHGLRRNEVLDGTVGPTRFADMREELETVAERCGIEIEKDMAASERLRLTQS